MHAAISQPTKPGKYGTLRLFEVHVTPADPGDPARWHAKWAYDAEHAYLRVSEDEWFAGDTIGDVRRAHRTAS